MRFVKLWLPVLLWAGLIVSASSDMFSSDQTRSWLEWMVGRDVPDAMNVAVRKLAHVAEYAILGFLAWRADRRFLVAVCVAAIVAFIDESRQSMSAMRTGSPWDVLLDVGGASLAVTLLRWRMSSLSHSR